MYKTKFGKGKQMRFADENEFYETLGFLAKSDGSIELIEEPNQNQGAWAHEGRILCYSNPTKFPTPLKNKLTKGRGKKILNRINCTEFVLGIIAVHKFVKDSRSQNTAAIRITIPAAFLNDFDRGFTM